VTPAIGVDKLAKTFRKPFSGRKVEAVRDVTFQVRPGQVYGFVGPNGAGKTTCIKMLTGLIFATGGRATIFGHPIPSPEAMQRVGFVPENPYIYPYLTPREFVDHCGRLSGLSGAKLHVRVEEVINRVGMSEAIDRPVRALSKGMTQRTALAAALVHDPDLLILDEPMSGLDPVGRRDVRDLILEERARKKTVFFSTHILGDVETLCDRVCILRRGEVVVEGALGELLDRAARTSEITIDGADDTLKTELRAIGALRAAGVHVLLDVPGDEGMRAALEKILARGARVVSITSRRETLEELFVRRAL
jgi:ABC-2 type transport system ATP-binding protein